MMITTDSMKLFLRNGGLVWQVMVYVIICTLLLGGLSLAICMPFIQRLSEAGCFDRIFDIFTGNVANIQLGAVLGSVSDLIIDIINIISANIGTMLPFAIAIFLIWGVLGSFLYGLGELAIADCLYSYMGSSTKMGFTSCFIRNIVRSVKLQLSKLLVVLPINFVIVIALYGCLMMYTASSVWVLTIAPFVVILVATVLIALKRTLVCAWAPCIIVQNTETWESLGYCLPDVFKNFGKIYGRQFILTLIIIAVTIAAIILTASVGLVLIIPAGIVFCNLLNMVIYFYLNGLKFYVDDDVIVASKKKETLENINSLKDII